MTLVLYEQDNLSSYDTFRPFWNTNYSNKDANKLVTKQQY